MTDYGAPTTPAQAMRQHADECRVLAEIARKDAAKATLVAETWDSARYAAEKAADMYERWQPVAEDQS